MMKAVTPDPEKVPTTAKPCLAKPRHQPRSSCVPDRVNDATRPRAAVRPLTGAQRTPSNSRQRFACGRTFVLVTTIEGPSEGRKRRIKRWAGWLSLAIPLAAVIIYLLIWYGPDVIARHDVGNVTGPLRVLRLQQARDAARGRLLTLGAGLFAAGALIFTGRNYGLARRTYQLTEEGQVTDRYTKAIEQLGSAKLD